MKHDIKFPTVEGISIAVVKEQEENSQTLWQVYLVNSNDFDITNLTVRSKGYGNNSEGLFQETSTLRYFINSVGARRYEPIELIDESVFHLNNEYWVSYFVNEQIYDKKFIFVPDSIIENNLTPIPILERLGVLHK